MPATKSHPIDVLKLLEHAPVDTRIWFEGEKKPYRVQARSSRFLICNKPFALMSTVLYCIVDLKEKVRGPENLVFGMGAETRKDCEDMLKRLEGGTEPINPAFPDFTTTEVSHRHRAPLSVTRVDLSWQKP